MVRPTDGDEPTEQPNGSANHPDLTGLAGEMRAEWRAEQELAASDAAALWRHNRSLADWLRDRMHAGDRIGVTVATRSFVGLVEEVGHDLVALRCAFGRVEIHVCAELPASFEVVEHATEGGTRSVVRREFRDALLARDEQTGLSVGTIDRPDGIDGSILVSRDFVAVVATDGTETLIPIAHIAWVAPDSRSSATGL